MTDLFIRICMALGLDNVVRISSLSEDSILQFNAIGIAVLCFTLGVTSSMSATEGKLGIGGFKASAPHQTARQISFWSFFFLLGALLIMWCSAIIASNQRFEDKFVLSASNIVFNWSFYICLVGTLMVMYSYLRFLLWRYFLDLILAVRSL